MRLFFCVVTIVALGLAVGLGEATAQRLSKDDDRAGEQAGKKRRTGSDKAVAVTGRMTGTITAANGKTSLHDAMIKGTGNLSAVGRVECFIVLPNVTFDRTNQRFGFGSLKGTGTMTTAKGEKIFGTFRLRGASLGLSPKGEVSTQVDLEVTGGTGRFKGATGRAVGTLRSNVFDQTIVADLDGQVELKQDQSQNQDKEVKRDRR
jgi:hypothetical protein